MYKGGHSPYRGWSQAWGERSSSDSFPLSEPVSGKCSHLPAATNGPRLAPPLRCWPQMITREHSDCTICIPLLCISFSTLESGYCYSLNSCQPHYGKNLTASEDPQQTRKKFVLFFFPSFLQCILYTKSILFMYQHESLHSCSDY